MSSKYINLFDFFNSSSLVTRESVRVIFSTLAIIPESNITLDFSKIDYASRSFFDEINSQKKKLDLLGKKIEIINLKDSLEQLNIVVQNTLLQKVSGFYSSVANVKIVTM